MHLDEEGQYQGFLREQSKQQEDATALALTYLEIDDESHNFRLSTQDTMRYHEYHKKMIMRCVYIDPLELEAFRCQAEVKALISQPKWRVLFWWRENMYLPILYEFLLSMQCAKNPKELDQ